MVMIKRIQYSRSDKGVLCDACVWTKAAMATKATNTKQMQVRPAHKLKFRFNEKLQFKLHSCPGYDEYSLLDLYSGFF